MCVVYILSALNKLFRFALLTLWEVSVVDSKKSGFCGTVAWDSFCHMSDTASAAVATVKSVYLSHNSGISSGISFWTDEYCRRIIICLALRLILMRIEWLGWLPLVPSVLPIETPQSMRSCQSYNSHAEDAELND
jgi:hypothetical protein